MTDFVVAAVHEAAQKTIEQTEVIQLSLVDQESIAKALLSRPQVSPALARAFVRRTKLLQRTIAHAEHFQHLMKESKS